MEKNYKRYFLIAVVFFILFGIFTYLVQTVDVAAIGPEGSSVGFSTLNKAGANIFKYNEIAYGISQLIGGMAIGTCAFMGLEGLAQWIKRKNILKVDTYILVLGVFYLLVIGTYIFFTKVAIAYRPIIIEGEELEASYPSSHTMLSMCVFTTIQMVFNRMQFKDKSLRTKAITIARVLVIAMPLSRLVSGVHWITDFIGSGLVSFALIMLFKGGLAYFDEHPIVVPEFDHELTVKEKQIAKHQKKKKK